MALKDYEHLFDAASAKYGVPKSTLLAMARQESNFNPNARSEVGAGGLMQLMPDTAKELGVKNVFDPAENVDAGARYYSQLSKQFGPEKGILAYHQGPGNVQRGTIGPKGIDYIKRVIGYENEYGGNMGLPSDIAAVQQKDMNSQLDADTFRKAQLANEEARAKQLATPPKEPEKKKMEAMDIIMPLIGMLSGGMALGPMGIAAGALGGHALKKKIDLSERQVTNDEVGTQSLARERIMKEPQDYIKNLHEQLQLQNESKRADAAMREANLLKDHPELLQAFLKQAGVNQSTEVEPTQPQVIDLSNKANRDSYLTKLRGQQ